MRFDKFKRLYKSADKIIFSTKDDKCYIFDGFTSLKFDKDLRGKILENWTIVNRVDRKKEKNNNTY